MSFRKIWEAEGLDKSGFKAACTYVRNCMKYRGDFLHYNKMTNRLDYLYITLTNWESFAECWMLEEKSTGNQQMEAVPSASSSTQAAPAPVSNEPGKEENHQTTPTPPKRANVTSNPAPTQGKENAKGDGSYQKELAKEVMRANKVKAKYHEVSSGAASLVRAVAEYLSWAWLKSAPTLMEPMQVACTTME